MTGTGPKQDPARLELRAKPAPVTRLNRRTLVALVGGLALCVLLATLWAFRPSEGKQAPMPDAHNVERVAPAEGLQALPDDYRQVPAPAPPPAEAGTGNTGSQEQVGEPALPDTAARAAQQRLQSEADAAARAQVLFETSDTADASAPAIPRIPEIPSEATAGANQDGQRPFPEQVRAGGGTHNRICGNTERGIAGSSHRLLAGTVIPAALLTAINSDLPGQVIATVTAHVYDSSTGRQLLIPQGSRLIGRYDSEIDYGQRRVLLAWTRLIRPDGVSVVLDRLAATDAAGQSGLAGEVDWHWRRSFAGAALSTLIGVGAELAAPGRDDADGTVIVVTRDGLQRTVNQIGQQVIRRELDVQPTLTIRAGHPVRAILNCDLALQASGA